MKNLILATLLTISASHAIDMQTSLQEIVKNHPIVVAAEKEYQASRLELQQSEQGFRPTLDFEAEAGYEYDKNSTTRFIEDEFSVKGAKFILRQQLFNSHGTHFDIKTSQAKAKSSFQNYLDKTNQIVFESITAYLNILKNYALLNLGKENVDIHRKILKNVKIRLEQGIGKKSELERVAGRLAASQGKYIIKNNNYKESIYVFHKYLGRYVNGEDLAIPQFNDALLPVTLEDALKGLADGHPVLKMGALNVETKYYEYKKFKNKFTPKVDLEVSEGWRQGFSGVIGEEKNFQAVVKFKYNLYNKGNDIDESSRMVSLIHKENEVVKRLKRSLLNDLQLTWSGYRMLFSQMQAIRKNRFFMQKVLKSYKEEFKLGKRKLINILDAESEYQGAKSLLEKTKYDLMIAKFRILYTMGRIQRDLGLSTNLLQVKSDTPDLENYSASLLPLKKDFDLDSVIEKYDLCVNTILGAEIYPSGCDKIKTSQYLFEPLVAPKTTTASNKIHSKDELIIKKLKVDVPTRMEFISFEPKSIELSRASKFIMRVLVTQLKKLALEGLIELSVYTKEYESDAENYTLALQRAYSLKRLLIKNNLEGDIIKVYPFLNPKDAGTLQNFVEVKVVKDMTNAQKEYDIIDLANVQFLKGSSKLNEDSKANMKKLVAKLKTRGKVDIEIISFSNEKRDNQGNIALSNTRALMIKALLEVKGLEVQKMVPVAWGKWDDSLDIFSSIEKVYNRLEIVIRD
ncbi:MAG: TolC family protein [Candidatus Cloacimonetes bacterium]|nr:TolC family protein [Candidatus Cloacimonadota bacterium]